MTELTMSSRKFEPLLIPFFITVLSPYVSSVHHENTNPNTISIRRVTIIV